jgi:DNA adenine methylase
MTVCAANYEAIRKSNPVCRRQRALRFLYLNRTGYSGMYRINRRGEFNVPFGGGLRTPEPLWRHELLVRASAALRPARLICSDFEPIMESASEGDAIYCDPTYTVAHDNNGFRRYNEAVFSWSDQQRLAQAAISASGRGVMVVVSNAHHSTVLELYSRVSNCEVRTLERFSCISRAKVHRRTVSEYLFILRPK